ncbi:hypothetical protein ILUMI_18764 [Ignelater luminosus]|uniref:Uncharacterized protein n=1 Tax=Ignelater luminosus TaxID=2038154 RepID=A0A8K0CHD7_IGNLU|nr:hypothetical protein ILUMI_18764 [Ignelater luminosus]
MCYGLDSTRLRILSYQYAKELKLSISPTWKKEKKATEEWLRGFRQRYKTVLSCTKPEKASLSRATALNATTGLKQVGQATSTESGEFVTVLNLVKSGSFIPPVFIFSRVRFKQFMLTGAPSRSLRLAYILGWMTEEHFPISMQHFVKNAKPTPESKVLLLMNNHGSHVNHKVVNFAKQKTIVLLKFSPH